MRPSPNRGTASRRVDVDVIARLQRAQAFAAVGALALDPREPPGAADAFECALDDRPLAAGARPGFAPVALDAGRAVVEIMDDVALMRPRAIGQIEHGGIGVRCDLAVGEEAEPLEFNDANDVAGGIADLDGRYLGRALHASAGPEVLRACECVHGQARDSEKDQDPCLPHRPCSLHVAAGLRAPGAAPCASR
jgi:hypothetical protein